MTIKDLFIWAAKHNLEDYEIRVLHPDQTWDYLEADMVDIDDEFKEVEVG